MISLRVMKDTFKISRETEGDGCWMFEFERTGRDSGDPRQLRLSWEDYDMWVRGGASNPRRWPGQSSDTWSRPGNWTDYRGGSTPPIPVASPPTRTAGSPHSSSRSLPGRERWRGRRGPDSTRGRIHQGLEVLVLPAQGDLHREGRTLAGLGDERDRGPQEGGQFPADRQPEPRSRMHPGVA